MKKPDMLIFLSDQHNSSNSGFAGDALVKTPNLDRIASKGVVFENAYTSCPLCVPARSSMLTGQLPSKTGITTNFGAIPSDQATFIHSIAAEGYETVLCGRMHFVGDDQRHGFTKRLGGDICPLYWGMKGDQRTDLGVYMGTTGEGKCLNVIGKGSSPVLEYDKMVIDKALKYLAEDHEKPQCIVVGTYAPHFTYVAPPEEYDYYREKVILPDSITKGVNYEHPVVSHRVNEVEETTILEARAAYYGMITNMDRQIGQVREAYQQFLDRNDRKGIFVYMSDHGDQVGDRKIFAKHTFYDSSAGIPLVFEGEGIKHSYRIKTPVSIMDLGPTMCDMIGAQTPPEQDGKSLFRQITTGEEDNERYIFSEMIDTDKKGFNLQPKRISPGRMVRKGDYKLISYYGYEEYDLLFNLKDDPQELNNIIYENQDKAEELRVLLYDGWNGEQQIKIFKRNIAHHKILFKWGQIVNPQQNELWIVPEEGRIRPIK